MTLYLYIYDPNFNDSPWQSDQPPTEEQAQQVIDGELQVFRVETAARMEIYEPIQDDDKDSWGDLAFQRK